MGPSQEVLASINSYQRGRYNRIGHGIDLILLVGAKVSKFYCNSCSMSALVPGKSGIVAFL